MLAFLMASRAHASTLSLCLLMLCCVAQAQRTFIVDASNGAGAIGSIFSLNRPALVAERSDVQLFGGTYDGPNGFPVSQMGCVTPAEAINLTGGTLTAGRTDQALLLRGGYYIQSVSNVVTKPAAMAGTYGPHARACAVRVGP